VAGFAIKLNSLGCVEDKKKLSQILKTKLKKRLTDLCADCQDRFNRNVFRILDCKNQVCRGIIEDLQLSSDYLCADCNQHFLQVKNGLIALGIDYKVESQLVRGLDYYTRTVFEITHPGLGSQDALGAGGRYDNLVKELGGPDLGAIGFAFGVERLMLAREKVAEKKASKLVYIISLGEAGGEQGLILLEELRKNNIAADTDYTGKSLKAAMRAADDLAARIVLIIGEDELKKNVVTLKDMQSAEQKEVKPENLIIELKAKA
jgi:histidyl-tRNA synthetase